MKNKEVGTVDKQGGNYTATYQPIFTKYNSRRLENQLKGETTALKCNR